MKVDGSPVQRETEATEEELDEYFSGRPQKRTLSAADFVTDDEGWY